VNAVILGVSPDSTKSQKKFRSQAKSQYNTSHDPEHEVIGKYGFLQVKKMYGRRKNYEVVRTNFIIDPDVKIAHIWNTV